jgi:hypothetical protein
VKKEGVSMDFLKKEWKTLLIIAWLIVITIFLFSINGQLDNLSQLNTKLASTVDTVESVVISTDANINQMSEKTDGIKSNVEFIVTKIRRR